MPELPEVETICRMLAHSVIGSKLLDIRIVRRDLRWPVQLDFEERCLGAEIISVFRRGKYIVIELCEGYIIWHLGMSGSIQLFDRPELKKHDHVVMILSIGTCLIYNDPRRFGSLFWADDWHKHNRLVGLGLEPLAEATTSEVFYSLLRSKKKSIKETIMDAKLLVGVGNIYANESLFLAKVNPSCPANKLTFLEAQCLFEKIKSVLQKAIAKGGTTLSDHKQLDGKPGYFQQELQVYGRAGMPCVVCNSLLQEMEHFSRQTVYCPKCQT